MNEPILKTVAMPPKLFWAPFLPAVANLAIQSPIMIMTIGVFDANPIFIVGSLFVVHIFLIIAGTREPHLSRMMESQGSFLQSYKTTYPEGGRKLAS